MLPSKTEFLKRVKGFKIIIHKDDGLYRHITLRHPDHSYGSFSIVTWPGYLSYNGDMGDYTFERLDDMFEFFRSEGNNKGISPDYWSQKLQAEDKRSGFKEFSIKKFESIVREDFEYWEFESPKQKRLAWEHIEWDLLNRPESVESAIDLGCSYVCPITAQSFSDFWDHNFTEFTFHYIFCCRAIPWAIDKYDKEKKKLNGTIKKK